MKTKLKVIFIGSYIPRKCGIATFTSDLLNAVASETNFDQPQVIAMNNIPEGYNYPPEVSFEIQQEHLLDYQRAADYINFSDIDLVCLQHEFGLYGGAAGEYLSTLIGNIRKPVVTSLHTIIKEPNPEYRKSMEDLINYSQKLVVMSQMGGDILREVYGVPEEKIELIYHGVPDIPFDSHDYHKKLLDIEGRLLILTFGFLNPGKGIEFMLDALPPVVEKYPDIVYIILGATHPEVKKSQGEKYRLSLERKVLDLGLKNNVIFHNRFVTQHELCEYISASDIYVTPYLSREQIVSGTLSYAIGMGKAIISTPYWYAQEMLADDRGLLVDFKDSKTLSQALLSLIDDQENCNLMRKKAYELGRQMTWKEVGRRYGDLFENVVEQHAYKAEKRWDTLTFSQETLPVIKYDHLRLLTDDVGIFQHTSFDIPDRDHGYSSDDIGRGLVALLNIYEEEPHEDILSMITRCLSFLKHAQTDNGHYHNFMGYNRIFLDEEGGEDTFGRALYGLGHVVCSGPTEGMRGLAKSMIEKSVPIITTLQFPRAKAYTICGLYAFLQHHECIDRSSRVLFEEKSQHILIKLADDLVGLYEDNAEEGWEWFEKIMTYGNAKICEALLRAFQLTQDQKYKKVGLATLDFLTDTKWNGTFFDLVGNEGWFIKGKEKAVYEQQPINAGYLVEAYITAYEVTADEQYLHLAYRAFDWFLGRNRLGVPLYDFATGEVADGLNSRGVNANKGAESIICFLLALLSLYRHS